MARDAFDHAERKGGTNVSARNLLVLCGMAACLAIPSQCFADDFDDAKTLANNFISQYDDIRSLTKSELQGLVKAMCNANEDELESVGNDASSRAKSDVQNKYDDLDKLQNQANQALDKVIADDNFQDKRSDAQSLKDRVNALWARIQRMTESVRGGNHPVVAYMRKAGQEAHKVYQSEHSSLCTVTEYPIKNRQADCINADQCWVIELKPNNDKAVDIGRSHAKEEADALNTDFDEFRKLVDKSSSFKNQCWRDKRFVPKVATYVFCPEIDDEGNYVSTSYGWSDPQN